MPKDICQALCFLVREHGAVTLLQDANLCRGLLNDHCLTEHLLNDKYLTERLREVNLLVCAVEEHVAAELLALQPATPSAAVHARLTQQLCTRHDLDEREAKWTVDAWAMALRGQVGHVLRPPAVTPAPRTNVSKTSKPAATPIPLPDLSTPSKHAPTELIDDLARAVRTATDGDTLHLQAREYVLKVPLRVDKSLTLIGAGRDRTIIRCEIEGSVVILTGDHRWSLQDLTVQHQGDNWANVLEVSGGSIDFMRCAFIGGGQEKKAPYRGGAGILASGSTRGKIQECLCQGNYNGIFLSGKTKVMLMQNCCNNSKTGGRGIVYEQEAGGEARNNQCRENFYGFLVSGTAQPLLQQNILEKNYIGMGLYNGGGEARENQCCLSTADGIQLSNNAKTRLVQNVCENNGRYGIHYEKNSSGSAERNRCQGNKQGDLCIEGSANPTLKGNTGRLIDKRK